jgi:hypothetical protein
VEEEKMKVTPIGLVMKQLKLAECAARLGKNLVF